MKQTLNVQLNFARFLSTMHSGGSAHIIPRFEPAKILDLIARHRLTRISGLPVMFNAMLHHQSTSDADLSSLKTILVGGDAVPPALQEGFEHHW